MTLSEQQEWVEKWCHENDIKLGHYDYYSARVVYNDDKVWMQYSDDSLSYSIYYPEANRS